MNPEFEDRNCCPFCLSHEGKEKIWTEEAFGERIDVWKCLNCAGGFSSPVPTRDFRLSYYQELAQSDTRITESAGFFGLHQQFRHIEVYKKGIELIRRKIKKGRLLDIGCGGGFFLMFAAEAGTEVDSRLGKTVPLFQAEGTEYDPRSIAFAKMVTGMPIHSVDDLATLPDASFDAITAFNVLEHVQEPISTLKELFRLLASGGQIVVVVPNNAMLFIRQRLSLIPPNLNLIAFEHINHFTPKSLTKMLSAIGFSHILFHPDSIRGAREFFHKPTVRDYVKSLIRKVCDIASLGRLYIYQDCYVSAEKPAVVSGTLRGVGRTDTKDSRVAQVRSSGEQ